MQQKENAKKIYLQVFALSMFIFARAVVFIDENRIGFNIADSAFSVSVRGVIIAALLLLTSLLTAVAMVSADNKCVKEAMCICALILADPLFFLVQNNGLKLIVTAVGLVFVLNRFRKSASSLNEILLCLFLFLSAFLMPYSVYCFVPLILIINIFPEIDNFFKNKKNILSFAVYAVCVIGGGVWNKLIFPRFAVFENFLVSFSFYDYTSVIKNNLFLLIGIPVAVLGIYFFSEYFKNAETGAGKKKAVFIIGFVILSYVLVIVGYVINGINSLYTLNLIVPAAILSLVSGKDEIACAQIKKINTFIQKHILAALMIYIVYNCVTILIMKNAYYVSNIVSHII